jgi:histidyl-tRNA synthetase
LEILKKVFTSYGFEPLETPSLEYEDLLTEKYGGEADKLIYKFEDQGKRKVALRYDQTVPLARVVATHQNELPMPFKRYQIQNVWRAENTQRGRYREFLQVDADIVGTYSPLADAEIILSCAKSLEELGFRKFIIKINDRNNFKGISPKAIAIIDKLNKIGPTAVVQELINHNLDANLLLEIKNKPPTEKINTISNILYKTDSSLKGRVKYQPTLARGLDYYTGMIFEVEIEEFNAGSVAGGGRYDNLIGMFAGKDIPAVGFSFGFDRIVEAMEGFNLFPRNLNTNSVFVAFSKPDLQEKALEITTKLRKKNISAQYFFEEASLEKQLKYADKLQIPYSIIVEKDNLILKDMQKRTQENLTLEKIIKAISS